MNGKLVIRTVLFTIALFPRDAVGQSSAPANISEDSPIQASVKDVSISECKAVNLQDGALHHYDLNLSGSVVLENRSKRPAIVYKDFFVLTVRIAASPQDAALGKFVAGFSGDRMALSGEPARVSFDDFIVIAPGKSFKGSVSTTVPASAESGSSLLHLPGRYWLQLGIDARPNSFYFDQATQREFKRKWGTRGKLVDFVLTKPFLLEVKPDPNAPLCKL